MNIIFTGYATGWNGIFRTAKICINTGWGVRYAIVVLAPTIITPYMP